MTFILALYAAILSTFLFGRWVRLEIIRWRAKKAIFIDGFPPEREAFIKEHPIRSALTPLGEALKDMKDEGELEGDVVREFELEMDRLERSDVEESVEEREWREEENIRLRHQRR
jgi:alpha/beta superfamily hydrolase